MCVWFASGSFCEVVCFLLRVFVCRHVVVCFVYDVPWGVVWFVCVCLSLCVWLFVFEMKCLAAVFVNYCVAMRGVVWSVYSFLFFVFRFVCDLLLAFVSIGA